MNEMNEINDYNFQLVQVNGVSQDIRDWEEIYNEVFILAPGRNPGKKNDV